MTSSNDIGFSYSDARLKNIAKIDVIFTFDSKYYIGAMAREMLHSRETIEELTDELNNFKQRNEELSQKNNTLLKTLASVERELANVQEINDYWVKQYDVNLSNIVKLQEENEQLKKLVLWRRGIDDWKLRDENEKLESENKNLKSLLDRTKIHISVINDRGCSTSSFVLKPLSAS